MTQNPPSQSVPLNLDPEPQPLDVICRTYQIATQDHLDAITEILVTGAPLDDWITYLATAAEHIAPLHRHPGPFLVILGQRISRAGVALILA